MKMNTAQITGAASEVELSGKIYRLSPLRDRDFGEFEQWVQDRYFDIAKRNTDGLSADEKNTLLSNALEMASKITLNSPEALKLMVSIEGAARLFYLSARREHPELTIEKVLELLTDESNLNKSLDKLDRINRVPFYKTKRRKKIKR